MEDKYKDLYDHIDREAEEAKDHEFREKFEQKIYPNPLRADSRTRNYHCVCGSKRKMKRCCGRDHLLTGGEVVQVNKWLNKHRDKVLKQIKHYKETGEVLSE